ncbi:MAG: hypothetical protein Ct9H90mP27_1750 [Gammaproteobacteria bacterium]|nr:MAG: hypothetical protein Ct9H90mP27_1750 [Gammaproteobacteria bacterium]
MSEESWEEPQELIIEQIEIGRCKTIPTSLEARPLVR